MPHTEVLVAGAGPTGLVLALWLHRLGVAVRIVDKAAEPATRSRALGIQARTLEFYRQLGLADVVVSRGLEFAAANLWVGGRHRARAAFGEMGVGISPYPYMLILPQDTHERLLIEHLARAGLEVERRTELLGFDEGAGDSVTARLRLPDGTEQVHQAAYVAGCDGASSLVRGQLGVSFPGGTYQHLFYVADVQATGPVVDGELHVALDESDFLAAFPMQGSDRVRLVGMAAPSVEGSEPLEWDDVSKDVLKRLGVDIGNVNWFSTYRVHHRVANRFRQGRVFLLGDAAHIHSPVGAQGMNTGIADAVNLGWKLAAVLQDRALPALLDSYEPERIAFARRLVATTDRAFTAVTSPGRLAKVIRTQIVPRILPFLTTSAAVRRFMFRTISQTAVHYRFGSLSEGKAGQVAGGDRLPFVPSNAAGGTSTDNYAPLASLDWQVHVYGAAPRPDLMALCSRRSLTLNAFPQLPALDRSGVRQGACYLVRPDGYVGLADAGASPAQLEAYLDRHGLRPRGA